MNSILRWWLIATLLMATAVRAETVSNLYEAESPVVGQGSEARAEAIRDAFARVLVKVSGDRGLLSNPEIDKLLKRASSYVQQYRYRMLQEDLAPSEADKPDRVLWVRFDERAVNRLLRQSGVPVWGDTRPTVLVWLGEERGAARSLLSLEQRARLKATLLYAADARG
ncbi:MAG: DUF2066 domain-containing protein, partial [Candidatus Thiodiazotropha sp.]